MATTWLSPDDGSIPGRTLQEQKETLKTWYQCNLDRYYNPTFTFQSIFIPLTPQSCKIWQKLNRGKELTKDEFQIYKKEFLKPLQKAISQFKNGAFVRFSTRSPKDAVDKNPKRLEKFLVKNLPDNDDDPNELMIALKRSFFQYMRVFSAEEAMELLSHSARCVSDVKRALEHQDNWCLQLVVREFVDFDISQEFRAFCYNGKLTAVSQYYTECAIQKKILDFFETIKHQIPVKNCIIDFVVTKDRVYVVEMNPFVTQTGSALFDWKKDAKLLREGPFELRLQQDVQYSRALLLPWREHIKRAFSARRRDSIFKVIFFSMFSGLLAYSIMKKRWL